MRAHLFGDIKSGAMVTLCERADARIVSEADFYRDPKRCRQCEKRDQANKQQGRRSTLERRITA